jgi:hypothetical protein
VAARVEEDRILPRSPPPALIAGVFALVEPSSPDKPVTSAPRRGLAAILAAVRRVLGSLFQIVFHDQLRDIKRQTQRLGSASVESATYLGSEVRALDQRLESIERELAELRALLERDGSLPPAEDSDEIAAPPRAG